MRWLFTGVVLLLALLSMSVAGLSPALADQCTPRTQTSTGLSCKDPAFPKCQFNPARQEWKCIGRNNVACGSPYLTWNCNPGWNCNGDGRTQPLCRR
jgi:hypothetical protein